VSTARPAARVVSIAAAPLDPAPLDPPPLDAVPLDAVPLGSVPLDPAIVAVRAYELFLESGGVHGYDVEHWLRAERELLARRLTSAA
jgi:hypothetical protein